MLGVVSPFWRRLERSPSPRSSLIHLATSPCSLCQVSFVRTDVHATKTSLITSPLSHTHVCNGSTSPINAGPSDSLVFLGQDGRRGSCPRDYDAFMGELWWIGICHTNCIILQSFPKNRIDLRTINFVGSGRRIDRNSIFDAV